MVRLITGAGRQSDSDYTQRKKRHSRKVEKRLNNQAKQRSVARYDQRTWPNMSYSAKDLRERNNETGAGLNGRPKVWLC
ncbi:hypothetical protein [Levilactobacillus brevis]|uniref:hypothetical protein n=1 Tax=Levilactobacillus brevis TaxID=1580 RepID=UPI000A208FF0|nr:hypothetical protein [Levilactobacillus brevis]ARN97441.1 hypothetical protein AZI10_04700 [Levilactobacillus brevis]